MRIKDGKIELTNDELKKLLDEAYWEGYYVNSNRYVYTSPSGTTIICVGDTEAKA